MLRAYQTMEQYEAVVYDHPGMKHLPGMQKSIKEDIGCLRDRIRKGGENIRQLIFRLEKILTRDESINGWKGENRFVEFYED